jgi:hypothetical protein
MRNEMSAAQSQHEADFYQCSLEQACLLRSGDWNAVDVEHLAEEIEDIGKSVRRERENRRQVLIFHLIKWKTQPGLRCTSWQLTIQGQRDQLQELLADNPSLKNQLPYLRNKIYTRAIKRTVLETGHAEETFPEECPFLLEEILDESFWPN